MEIETSQAVAAELRATIARQGVKQIDLASHLGMSQQAMSSRLKGQTSISVDELIHIGHYLRADVPAILRDAINAQRATA